MPQNASNQEEFLAQVDTIALRFADGLRHALEAIAEQVRELGDGQDEGFFERAGKNLSEIDVTELTRSACPILAVQGHVREALRRAKRP